MRVSSAAAAGNARIYAGLFINNDCRELASLHETVRLDFSLRNRQTFPFLFQRKEGELLISVSKVSIILVDLFVDISYIKVERRAVREQL